MMVIMVDGRRMVDVEWVDPSYELRISTCPKCGSSDISLDVDTARHVSIVWCQVCGHQAKGKPDEDIPIVLDKWDGGENVSASRVAAAFEVIEKAEFE